MDKNRFRQLIESSLGNIKPLISESDDFRNIGQDETSKDKQEFREKTFNFILTKIERGLNGKYPSSTKILKNFSLNFTKPNVFIMELQFLSSATKSIVFTTYDKNTRNEIKTIIDQYGSFLNVGDIEISDEKVDGVKEFYLVYPLLNVSKVEYPGDKERKFESFYTWFTEIIYNGVMEFVPKIYGLGSENKEVTKK